ncbi:hypothetical protein [Brachymonas chironomi]|uniref:Y-family DNA polymerase n=1 Tax=Brachymonas chironomi TaxID=491919 RepID=UPI00038033B5|nr:hypothetical protein [Brachymonas chironomi]
MLRILFIDFNAYFASVEQQLDASLRGKPVVVAPVLAETSCCIAVSYEAREHGIRTGTRISEARRLCPRLIVREARPELYVQMHHRAVAVVDSLVPVLRVMSIDEMACELTGSWRTPERARWLAGQLRQRLHDDLGECLRVSIGIGPNILLAKQASNMHKPDGLTVITREELPQRMLALALRDIHGIGRRLERRLQACGIHTVEQLYAAPRDLLRTVWGSVEGSAMYDKLRGEWHLAPEAPARSISHSHVLPPAMRHPEAARAVLHRLLQKAAMRLRRQGFYAQAMQVWVQGYLGMMLPEASTAMRDLHFQETRDTAALLRLLDLAWGNGLGAVSVPQQVGVLLHGLVPQQQHTPDLFEDPGELPGITPRARDDLLRAVDALNQRFGRNAVYFATSHEALEHAPMRIAFSRIPDLDTEA